MSAPRRVRTAVIPAGGLGTRFLPFSRSVPKELLPLVDTPVIDFVVSECVAAGIERIVIVGAPGKEAIARYFRPQERLRERLAAEGRAEDLQTLERSQRLADVRVVVQEEARGNGHAVLVAREAVGDEPFAMIWADDLVLGGAVPAVAQLVAARERLGGGSVVAALRVGREDVSGYGILAGTAVDERTLRVRAVVEKPAPSDAPSDLAAVHGYVLEPEIFDVLASLPPGRGGEIWLSDAVSALAARAPVWAVELAGGRRFDVGGRAGYVAAFLEVALGREDTAAALREYLRRVGWRAPPGEPERVR